MHNIPKRVPDILFIAFILVCEISFNIAVLYLKSTRFPFLVILNIHSSSTNKDTTSSFMYSDNSFTILITSDDINCVSISSSSPFKKSALTQGDSRWIKH